MRLLPEFYDKKGVGYTLALTFYFAAFPRLAKDTPELQTAVEKLREGSITDEEYSVADSLQRNRLSNISLCVCSCGEVGPMMASLTQVVILAIAIGIIKGIGNKVSNHWSLSVVITFATACWVALALPWFFLEKRRAGQTVPPGMNIITVGLRQLLHTMQDIFKLRQTFIYLVGYFIISDTVNTQVKMMIMELKSSL